MLDDRNKFATLLQASPLIGAIFARWSRFGLPDGWLAAGAVAQTAWNALSGRPPLSDIRDVDLVYFDAADLSAEAERRHEARIRELLADLAVEIDAKNQARVHLWYRAKFGSAIEPYPSIEAAIASFPTTATAVGVRTHARGLEVCAPFGLHDLLAMTVRPNKRQVTRAIYDAKAARWRRCWPRLTVIEWDEAAPQ